MRKNFVTILAIGLMTIGCKVRNTSYFRIETEKWTKELYYNGEVGKPCRKDNNWQKWQENNPNYYFGLQEVLSMKSDFNSDGIKDGIFYFPAQNCVAGNVHASDFAMLIYSNDGQFLTNKNITRTIEGKIKGSLAANGTLDIYKVIINYKGLGRTIIGIYSAWNGNDANCCPSFGGTFEYDPTDFILTVKNKQSRK